MKSFVFRIALLLFACAFVIGFPELSPAQNWTGFSLGVTGGGGTGTSSQTDSGIGCSFFNDCAGLCKTNADTNNICISELDGSYRMGGGLFGGGLTYNFWQTGPWVVGVAGDASWANISGSSSVCGAGSPVPHPCGTTLEGFDTVRGTIGYAIWPNWLLYGTGGYAGGDLHAWDALAGGSGTKYLSGWSAGAGIEYKFTPSMSVKFEYLHVDLGHAGIFDVVPGVLETVSFSGDLFRVGLNWQFNSYAPSYRGRPTPSRRSFVVQSVHSFAMQPNCRVPRSKARSKQLGTRA